ncbi:MAG: DNA-3-methyladenine glycosylase I [Kangiellaceae bacterium]|nr:DNA-3-methyladenine glycosylase I [Kangiellaceae bacterium]
MESFERIYDRASSRKGGAKELLSLLPNKITKRQINSLADREYLAEMTRKVFQSGFIWRVVDNKWTGFEQVFWGFEPAKLELASDEQIEGMAQDKRIIRNFTKVKSVRENAYFVKELSDKHNGFGRFLSSWKADEVTSLWLYLKKNGCRLGGNTGPYFLRVVGIDTFLLTKDIVGYFIAQKLVERHPNSQRDLKVVQQVFNEWQKQSGMTLAQISKIVACSVGENYINE